MPLYHSNGNYYWQDSPGSIAKQVNARADIPGTNPVTKEYTYDSRGALALPSNVITSPFGASVDSGQVPRYPDVAGGSGGGSQSELDRVRASLFGGTAGGGAPTDLSGYQPLDEAGKQKIRDQVRQQMQAYLDSINLEFNNRLSAAKVQGEGRLGQDRALQSYGGTSESSFGRSQTGRVNEANNAVYAGIESERGLRLAAVFDKIDQRALDEVKAQNDERAGKANALLTYLTQNAAAAKEDIKTIANSGLPLNQIAADDYKKLLSQSGMDPLVFQAYYNANLPKAAQREYHYEKIGNTIVAFSANPKTGQLERQEFPSTAPAGYDEFTVTADGTPLFVNKQSGQAVIAPGFKQGQFREPLKNLPESYKEWTLAGKQGTYADFMKEKSGPKFSPTADEKSATNRYATEQGYSDEDMKKLATDPGFFYATLQNAIEASNSSGNGPSFPLQPFKYPFLIGQ